MEYELSNLLKVNLQLEILVNFRRKVLTVMNFITGRGGSVTDMSDSM